LPPHRGMPPPWLSHQAPHDVRRRIPAIPDARAEQTPLMYGQVPSATAPPRGNPLLQQSRNMQHFRLEMLQTGLILLQMALNSPAPLGSEPFPWEQPPFIKAKMLQVARFLLQICPPFAASDPCGAANLLRVDPPNLGIAAYFLGRKAPLWRGTFTADLVAAFLPNFAASSRPSAANRSRFAAN
jgi:hypothetical protein